MPGTGAHGDDGLGELGPPDLAAVALDDGGRPVLRSLDDGEPGRPECRRDAGAADGQDAGAGAQQLRHHGRGGLGAGDDVGGIGGDPELGEVPGHVVRRPSGVVGHEPERHARRRGRDARASGTPGTASGPT